MASDAGVFLGRLQRLVKANDKKGLSALVHYPLRVFSGDRRIEIASPLDFVRKYSSIVTPNVRHAILVQSPDCLFGNYEGIMIGNGQVWLEKEKTGEMKVITISPNAL